MRPCGLREVSKPARHRDAADPCRKSRIKLALSTRSCSGSCVRVAGRRHGGAGRGDGGVYGCAGGSVLPSREALQLGAVCRRGSPAPCRAGRVSAGPVCSALAGDDVAPGPCVDSISHPRAYQTAVSRARKANSFSGVDAKRCNSVRLVPSRQVTAITGSAPGFGVVGEAPVCGRPGQASQNREATARHGQPGEATKVPLRGRPAKWCSRSSRRNPQVGDGGSV